MRLYNRQHARVIPTLTFCKEHNTHPGRERDDDQNATKDYGD
jgi:hypothetical protein